MAHLDSLPNLVIAGMSKAGSSSLFWYLSQHSDICPADLKEVNFFMPLRYGMKPLGPLEDYARHFSHCTGQTFRLDGSPHYAQGGRGLVDAAHRHLPQPRILFVLRNPVDRFWSSYLSHKERGKLDQEVDFRSWFETCRTVAVRGQSHLPQFQRHSALAVGCYIDVLCDWFDVFGDDVRVLFFEHLAADPRQVVGGVCTWLGLDDSPAIRFDYSVRNKTVQPRSRAFAKVVRRVNLRVDRGTRLPPRVKKGLRSAYNVLNATRDREELSPQDRAAIEEYYEPANRTLYKELVQRGYTDFPQWLAPAG